MNVAAALTVSSDVFFYELGDALLARAQCRTPIQDMARTLGMGDLTDIDLPFEASGRVPDAGRPSSACTRPTPRPSPTREWYTGDNLNLAIGQGDTVVTPLQLANAYATFANGGTVYAPRVGGAVLDVERRGGPHGRAPGQPQDRPSRPRSATRWSPASRGWWPTPGARPRPPSPASRSTGSRSRARRAPPRSSGKQDTALFAAFAPADDPRYVVTVVMEEAGLRCRRPPRRWPGASSTSVAGPAADARRPRPWPGTEAGVDLTGARPRSAAARRRRARGATSTSCCWRPSPASPPSGC